MRWVSCRSRRWRPARDWFLWGMGQTPPANAVLFAAFLHPFPAGGCWADLSPPAARAHAVQRGTAAHDRPLDHPRPRRARSSSPVVAFKLYASTDGLQDDDLVPGPASRPMKGVWQAIVLIIAWTHASIGLWAWMRNPAVVRARGALRLRLCTALADAGDHGLHRRFARDLMHLVRDPAWTQSR